MHHGCAFMSFGFTIVLLMHRNLSEPVKALSVGTCATRADTSIQYQCKALKFRGALHGLVHSLHNAAVQCTVASSLNTSLCS
ncbi:hypothetical protein T440DRAFT_467933 [Plenodomus tracheiphilus IPT5]|uniref:Secreted protein n=1 Tax=Plenodomus tracheiphilus IPT5 TaxID=1408161 RepID=A0A6A7B6V7_9PLEO|nr:hypothetical protein T440DRAFT_467933 [Plenodomus tracheiphilus IPT5]